MKKIAISLPDDIYRRARQRAAEQRSTIRKLAKDFIVRLAGYNEAEFERRKQLQDSLFAQIRSHGFSASDRLTRDEIYDRKLQRKLASRSKKKTRR